MAVYSIDGPDGKKYEIPGPPGMSREQVIAEITRQLGEKQAGEQVLSNMSKNIKGIVGNVMRGGVDVIGGGAQMLSRGAASTGLVPESEPQRVEAQNAQAYRNVDDMLGKSEGFSPVRAGSAALASLPVTPTKFLQAPTLLGRAFGAGTSGAVSSAVQAVPEPASEGDFWKRKGMQAGAGFVGGTLAQPIAEKVVGSVVSAVNAGTDKAVAGVRNMTGANSIDKLVSLTRDALKRSGIDFDALNEQTQQKLLGDVQAAMSNYSGVNPGAVARQGAFREAGFDPLRHWITRDPSEFTAIENLSHQPAGAALKQKKADLDQYAENALLKLRGEQPDPAKVGQSAQRDLKGYLAGEKGKTNVLYDTFQKIAPDAKGDPQRFVNMLFDGLEGKMAGSSLPGGLRDIINQVSKGEIPLTPSTLYQLQKMGNKMYGADGSTNFALGHMSRAIDKELEAISRSVAGEGSQAADVLKMARGQAAKTFGAKEESKVLRAVEDGAPPENFLDTLKNTDLKDLAASWTKLGPEAKAGVRAQTVDELKRLTFGGATEGAGKTASQASLNKYLTEPKTAQRLKLILGDDGFAEVKRLGLMLESAHMQPSGSAVNNSKTGGALIGGLDALAAGMKAKNIPGGSFAADMSQRGMAQAAQSVPADALGQRSLVIDPMVEELLKRRFGHGAGLLGAGGAYTALDGLLGR